MKGVGFMRDDDRVRRSNRRSRLDRDRESSGGIVKWVVRLIAWGAVASIFFCLGYLSSGWLLNYLDGRGMGGQPDVVASKEQAEQLLDSSSGDGIQTLVDMGRHVAFPIYVPDGKGGLAKREVKIVSGLMEDDLSKVVNALLDGLVEKKVLASDVGLLHVFRDGETLFMDFNDPFEITLSKMSASEGNLLMTGIVRSVVENFMPVTRVQFMVEGKIEESAGEVPLSMPWELRRKG